ncbi:MAG: dienelactone hydrolase family protein [Bacteroidota bacterium]
MKTLTIPLTTLSMLTLLLFTACGQEEKSYTDRMAEEHQNDSPVANEAQYLGSSDHVQGMEVTYATINDQSITGYLAKPEDGSANRPGIIVIHEWWGLNDNIRMMTDKLAAQGYTALAVDMYNDQVADDPEQAREFMQQAMQDEGIAIQNLEQAYAYLNEAQNAPQIGVIGWCFGGGWSLQTALTMPDKIDAAVIYYGRLVTDLEQLAQLNMPILGIFGAEDQGIPVESVKEFEAALNDLDKNASIHIYEGADHAFANPSGTRYNAEAAKDAWDKTTTFFEQHLKE